MRATSRLVTLLACSVTVFVVGCRSKRDDKTTPDMVVAAPSSASATNPRVKVEVFAVRGSASGAPSLEVATTLTFTPKKCDPSQYLVPTAGSVGPRRRMTLFRVKDVSLTTPGTTIVASQGGANPADVWPEQGGERAIVIDCVDDVPDPTPFPFFFTFVTPEGFDARRAMLVLEGERTPLAAFAKGP